MPLKARPSSDIHASAGTLLLLHLKFTVTARSCYLWCLQEQEAWVLQQSCEELRQQLESSEASWRGQVDELKAQLRGEATRVLELQKKAYNAKMATEAAEQV